MVIFYSHPKPKREEELIKKWYDLILKETKHIKERRKWKFDTLQRKYLEEKQEVREACVQYNEYSVKDSAQILDELADVLNMIGLKYAYKNLKEFEEFCRNFLKYYQRIDGYHNLEDLPEIWKEFEPVVLLAKKYGLSLEDILERAIYKITVKSKIYEKLSEDNVVKLKT